MTNGIVRSAEMAANSGNGSTTYSAKVTYTYQVRGVDYAGDKIAVAQMSASSDYARQILNRYPVGKQVSVHYAPGDPSQAVLEPGIHGGTWICLGVGTAFVLFGILFLQIQRAAVGARIPGQAQSSSVLMQPDGRVGMDKPPVLMGVICLLVGIGLSFVPPDPGKPAWMMYAVGGFFGTLGVFVLLWRLKNKAYSRIAVLPAILIFLVIFHWVSFGPGDRSGTATTPFSVSHYVNVRTPFAIFTILVDLALLGASVHWLSKRWNK